MESDSIMFSISFIGLLRPSVYECATPFRTFFYINLRLDELFLLSSLVVVARQGAHTVAQVWDPVQNILQATLILPRVICTKNIEPSTKQG